MGGEGKGTANDINAHPIIYQTWWSIYDHYIYETMSLVFTDDHDLISLWMQGNVTFSTEETADSKSQHYVPFKHPIKLVLDSRCPFKVWLAEVWESFTSVSHCRTIWLEVSSDTTIAALTGAISVPYNVLGSGSPQLIFPQCLALLHRPWSEETEYEWILKCVSVGRWQGLQCSLGFIGVPHCFLT